MSSPMPATLFRDRLRAALAPYGNKVVEMNIGGVPWYNNNRNSKGLWDNVHGIVEHHTGSDTTDPLGYAGFLFRGSSALPGPLCQFSTAPNGDIYLIGWGRCNHAGGGDPIVRDLVINDQVPWDHDLRPTKGNLDGVDGNREYYGNEIMYSGSHPMTAQQRRSSSIAYKIIMDYHGWGGNSLIGHKEWSDDKPDPGYQPVYQVRQTLRSGVSTGGNDVGQVDGWTQPALDQVVNAIFSKSFPWVNPAHEPGEPAEISPGYHPTQNLGNVISWVEEFTRRFVQEGFVQYIPQIVDQVAAKVTVATVDVAAVSKAVAAEVNAQVAEAVANEVAKRLAE